MSKVHFDAQGRGMWAENEKDMSECGESWAQLKKARKFGVAFKGIALTTTPALVTCLRCKRTKAYREAVEKGASHA